MSIKITTNNLPRPLVSWFDIPVDARNKFDYLDAGEKESDRFVFAYGQWHDFADTQPIGTGPFCFCPPPGSPLNKWHAILTDSAFTGIVFRIADEFVVAGFAQDISG